MHKCNAVEFGEDNSPSNSPREKERKNEREDRGDIGQMAALPAVARASLTLTSLAAHLQRVRTVQLPWE
uniref:Uncharacterized protein n=1 Tax=Globodera rostochiensis TaxID=31243 RepID=A0A914H1A7_GLORO